MDKNEFKEWFDEQVRSRWPEWPVNDITLADWFAAFASACRWAGSGGACRAG